MKQQFHVAFFMLACVATIYLSPVSGQCQSAQCDLIISSTPGTLYVIGSYLPPGIYTVISLNVCIDLSSPFYIAVVLNVAGAVNIQALILINPSSVTIQGSVTVITLPTPLIIAPGCYLGYYTPGSVELPLLSSSIVPAPVGAPLVTVYVVALPLINLLNLLTIGGSISLTVCIPVQYYALPCLQLCPPLGSCTTYPFPLIG
uniref:Regeneration-upregulated protein 1 n=1 Tax=Enchytraeus japonensis TaxID=228735 RepID=Q1MXG5_9ANNE|nr:regeneration-upregulated protein 1 [Enchytraeus japonensis]